MGKLKNLLLAVGVTIGVCTGIFVIPILITFGCILGAVTLLYMILELDSEDKVEPTKPNLHVVKKDSKTE